jgi:ParB family transcriptional regulator, chromosome partitioning protein
MATQPRGLGRGLGALLQDMSSMANDGAEVRMIPLTRVAASPHQPRQTFSEEALQELASSIRSQGVLQPILVRPGNGKDNFELIAGERRLRASALAGLDTVPALVRQISDEDAMAIALIENLQREDLNPFEEAVALGRLKEQLGLSQEDLAARIGRSRPAVANALRLLQLAPQVQEDLQSGRITAGHARAIVAIGDHDAQRELGARVKQKQLTVRQTEELASKYKEIGAFAVRPVKTSETAAFRSSVRKCLQTRLPCPVQFRGDKNKGSIVLRYNSPEELKTLLSHLGTGELP